MPQTYTPFFEKMTRNVGGAYMQNQQKQQLQQLTKAAYMGDPQAMAQLTAINPAVATQIQQSQRQTRQDKISTDAAQTKSQDRNRKILAENRDLIGDALEGASKFETIEEAQAFLDEQIEANKGIIDPAQFKPLTPETFTQIKTQFAQADVSAKEQAATAKLIAETEKLKTAGTGQPKLNDAQAKAAGYYGRMTGAQNEIDRVFTESPDFKPAALAETAPAAVSNILASVEFQQYKQAADDWIRAKLRRESGAVIATDEMEKEYSTYFPVFGDSKKVIEQKKRARKIAEESMKKGAGPAKFDDFNPGRKEVRRGQHNGRTVIEYADGTVEYAN